MKLLVAVLCLCNYHHIFINTSIRRKIYFSGESVVGGGYQKEIITPVV